MNIAFAWLRTHLNSTNRLRCWHVDSFPDLDTCLRDPNRYIDQKFLDWVIDRESRDPPDYLIDVHGESNICSIISELGVSAINRMNSTNAKYIESTHYVSDSKKTEETTINVQEIVDHRNKKIQNEINNNLDENGSKVKRFGELEKGDSKKIQRRSSRRSRNRNCKVSSACVDQPKHGFSEVPTTRNYSSHSRKTCLPLREIQDVPYRTCAEESSRLLTGRSQTTNKSSRVFNFNISVCFRCTVQGCGKLYRRRSHLQSHVRRHTGERPFACTWDGCRWKFSRSDELIRHMRSHSGDKPFKCATCNKCFARSDHLKKHLRVHLKALIG